jgi:SET domain-containing protein
VLIIQKSVIQGKGVFTDSAVRARTKLGEFTGEPISVREARSRAKRRKQIAIVEIDQWHAIDGHVGGGPFRFINHSCEPNVFVRVAYGRMEFYAKIDIPAGTELTMDYVNSHHNGTLRCRCGQPRCRGAI